jgi:arylsulfatase A-like enzyme
VGDTQAYDQIKVDAILNEVDRRNSTATLAAPEPAIFGMNFQAVSVGQKLVDPLQSCVRSNNAAGCDPHYVPGGYEPGSTSAAPIFTPQLKGAIQFVDGAVKSIVDELRTQGELASTTIIITAKHGQSPIDPALLHKIGSAEQTVLSTAGITSDGVNVQITDDDVSLVWLSKHDQGLAQAGVNALLQSEQHGNPARIQTVLSGDVLKDQFGDPAKDPRTPDIVIQPLPGTIYSGSKAKVMEHGGFAPDDTHVAMLVVNGADVANNTPLGTVVDDPVRTAQVAPTVLATLGLNPNQLDAVRAEHVQVLPSS